MLGDLGLSHTRFWWHKCLFCSPLLVVCRSRLIFQSVCCCGAASWGRLMWLDVEPGKLVTEHVNVIRREKGAACFSFLRSNQLSHSNRIQLLSCYLKSLQRLFPAEVATACSAVTCSLPPASVGYPPNSSKPAHILSNCRLASQ